MSSSHGLATVDEVRNGDASSSPRINGQLSTPALSPIDEHSVKPSNLLSESNLALLSQADIVRSTGDTSTRPARDRRQSSENKTFKLSPKQVMTSR